MPDVEVRAEDRAGPGATRGGQVGLSPAADGPNRVTLRGSLGQAEIDALVELCSPTRQQPGRDIVLDFTGMTECPSALLLTVARIGRRLSAVPVRLRIVGLDEALHRMVTAGP
jgi:hypothetical protein